MMSFPSSEQVERLRTQYPAGTRIRLIHMQDEHGVPDGTNGSVAFVDDAGQIHMVWQNGSTLALIPGVDLFAVTTEAAEWNGTSPL